jgi:hypothetical protein
MFIIVLTPEKKLRLMFSESWTSAFDYENGLYGIAAMRKNEMRFLLCDFAPLREVHCWPKKAFHAKSQRRKEDRKGKKS